MEQMIQAQVEAIVTKQLRLMEERGVKTSAFLVQLDVEKGTLEMFIQPIPIVKYIEVLPT